jgi:cystathionine gamma-synthase
MDMDDEGWLSAESALIHAGTERRTGAPVAPPLISTSVFVSGGDPDPNRSYGRSGNPSWEALERALGSLERAEAVVFASGQAASLALMLALTHDRDRILLPDDGYYNIRGLAEQVRPHGAEPVLVDLLDLEEVERQLAFGRSVLWAESPTNPLLRVADLARLHELSAAAGAAMVVDNTVATAVLQQPLEMGAVASICSLTKAASGHSDLLLGAVTTRDQALLAELRRWRQICGGIAGAFESWLALRGLKTLPLRIARQSESAQLIASHLATHPRVGAVHYPGLEPATRATAVRQMPHGFGPLLSFELAGDAKTADAVVGASRLIVPATSFGGVESTWERRARWSSETAPEALIRLSVGVEPTCDLLADLDASLDALL